MRRRAKAMSAFNFGRSGSAAGRDARSSAGRGGSSGFKGSGASSLGHAQETPRNRHYRVVAALSATVLTLVFVSLATASKRVADVFAGTGASGTAAGAFITPRDLAVNDTTGDVYVIDNANHRVQRFNASGGFISTWGRGVSTGSEAAQICTSNCQAGTIGTAEGMFDNPQGIDVNQATGDVYVRDRGNRRVQQFQANGTFVRAWGWGVATGAAAFQICTSGCQVGVTGANGGQFATSTTVSTGLAVDPTTNNVYVADPANRRVQEFGADGTFVRLWGWDVVATGQSGNLGTNNFETCTSTAAGVCKVGANATPTTSNGQFGTNQPVHLAVDANGIVYASDSTASNRVMRFDSAEIAAADLLDTEIPSTVLSNTTATAALESNPTNDHLLIARGVSLFELDLSTNPDPVTAAHLVGTHTPGLTPTGLDVETATGNFYAASTTGNNVYLLAEVDPPIVQILPASNVGVNSVILNASIDPTGTSTGYRFEISRDGVNWTQVPDSFVSAGSGSGPVNVSQPATGLEANTLYRVRVVAVKPPSGSPLTETLTSSELTFLTDAAPPNAETLTIVDRTSTSAKLVGGVNPNGTLTTYRFQWGLTTGYGNQMPIPPASAGMTGTPVTVIEEITGLQPDTTYHYRVVAQSPEGTSFGADRTFTTRAVAPAEGKRAYEMVTPPFKVARGTGGPQFTPGNNPNPAVPSLDGNSVTWSVHLFPLTDDVLSPMAGDRRIIRRTSDGWVSATRNTLPLLSDPTNVTVTNPAWFTIFSPIGGSGDFETVTFKITQNNIRQAGLLPAEGPYANRFYTRRDGTGVKGYTPWLDNPAEQGAAYGFNPGDLGAGVFAQSADDAVLNDSGSAMARWGWYRGLAGPGDPSVNQLPGITGGATIYLQRAAGPDGMPSAPKELVNSCTGTTGGGTATQIPARVGSGVATDTIGAQPCEQPGPPAATGTGTIAHNSATITSVNAESGAFAAGQIVTGQGIAPGTRIVAVGAGTLTLSANARNVDALGWGALQGAGSNLVTAVFTMDGEFEVGQTIQGTGIPAGTTITAIDESAHQLTLSANATAGGPSSFVELTVLAPAPATRNLTAHGQGVVSLRGATVGSNATSGTRNGFRNHANAGTSATAFSDDGKRVYFQAPDFVRPGGAISPPSITCTTQTGANSDCVPQLFVRSEDSEGNPVVRWISRSRSQAAGPDNRYGGAMIAGQEIALMGNGTAFQGASRDGRVVYFKTNAPLTPDDPNGTGSAGPVTTGSASNSSWDLYRFELPVDPDVDPDQGVLTRISGGPDGTADPSTATAAGDAPLRYHSDDGKLAYFLTTSPIPGAVNTPPAGGSTTPGGAVGNTQIRNLYLFDDDKTGAERYRFIARIPYWSGSSSSTVTQSINACASSNQRSGPQLHSYQDFGGAESGNCFRGTRDARAVAFATDGQLTADDDDGAGDVYHYDADTDELIRVSAPPPGVAPYPCNLTGGIGFANVPTNPAWIVAHCNAELDRHTGLSAVRNSPGLASPISDFETSRGWGGMRYYNIARDSDGVVSVFFGSQLQLLPEDVNNYMDVYQWRAGELSLISLGNAPVHSWYSGSSLDGESVFIHTYQRIDPREIDDSDLDTYVARIDGGFPYAPPPTPCNVLAFECEIEAAPGTSVRAAATPVFLGTGNVKPKPATRKPKPRRCAKGKARRGNRCVVKKRSKRAKSTNGRTPR